MTARAAMGLAVLLAFGAAPAIAADAVEPGQWKVTAKTEVAGVAMPEMVSMRCLRHQDVAAIDKTFVPELGGACRRVAFEWTGQKLSWRIQCTSPVAMENSGTFVIDSPRHYTAVLTVGTTMNGQQTIARTMLVGERVGDCPN